jgi:ABC-type sugar transport system ATPase subunit
VREPKAFLFDEPLSNLDAALRVQMRLEVTKLQKQLGTTAVYVTHDQVEAMTLADRIVVLNVGHVEQVGTPLDVYHRPRTLFAAGFLGSPKMNFLGGTVAEVAEHRVVVSLEGGGRAAAHVEPGGLAAGDAVTLGIRPEHLRVVAGDQGAFSATVQLVEDLGDHALLHLDRRQLDGRIIVKSVERRVKAGDVIHFELPPEDCHVFDGRGVALARREAPAS